MSRKVMVTITEDNYAMLKEIAARFNAVSVNAWIAQTAVTHALSLVAGPRTNDPAASKPPPKPRTLTEQRAQARAEREAPVRAALRLEIGREPDDYEVGYRVRYPRHEVRATWQGVPPGQPIREMTPEETFEEDRQRFAVVGRVPPWTVDTYYGDVDDGDEISSGAGNRP